MARDHKGLRQVCVYVDPELYERVRCAAYTIGIDIYEFFGVALEDAVRNRLTKAQRSAIHKMVRDGVHPPIPARKRREPSRPA